MWGKSVIFLFVAIWVGVGTVWIVLDWLGNPSRGAFHPAGRRRPKGFRRRRVQRVQSRAHRDAAIRATLRESYGRSSLRLTWSQKRELRSLQADSELITDPLQATRRRPELEFEPLLLEVEFESLVPTGWRLGDDVLVLTRGGSPPSASTVRSRVWKNCADATQWGEANAVRMASGRPPRRFNPIRNKHEMARVDLETGRPYWPDTAVDPFRTKSA